ncbi:hypothetical protein [Oceanobacillus picturae]|uniref:hypothetical protein n=1 Tax=Oceanobacillus picturae TaxID=171693 RepID=UPI000568C1A2|nr:hypothetical protein [Oceanobacillus picturae]
MNTYRKFLLQNLFNKRGVNGSNQSLISNLYYREIRLILYLDFLIVVNPHFPDGTPGWTEDEIHKKLDSIIEEDNIDVTEVEDIDEIIEE